MDDALETRVEDVPQGVPTKLNARTRTKMAIPGTTDRSGC